MTHEERKKYNEYMSGYIRRVYIKRKLDAIAYKGGKCIKCGYDKCPACLAFHHRNPNEKDLDWGKLRNRKWVKILNELDKCDLLCHNCHGEHHYDQSIADEAIKWLETHRPIIAKYQKNGVCPVCARAFVRNRNNRSQKYCSPECKTKGMEKADYPSDADFTKLVDEIGRVKVGRMFGVSDRSISKRYKRLKHSISAPKL